MASTYYTWDRLSNAVLMESDENGNTIATYSNDLDGTPLSQRRNSVNSTYHYDGLDNTVALTDDNGDVTDTYEYSAFGEVISKTGNTVNPFGFKGALGYYANPGSDELYVRERTYEPAIGRWMSVQLNATYAFGDNDPVNQIDFSTSFLDSLVGTSPLVGMSLALFSVPQERPFPHRPIIIFDVVPFPVPVTALPRVLRRISYTTCGSCCVPDRATLPVCNGSINPGWTTSLSCSGICHFLTEECEELHPSCNRTEQFVCTPEPSLLNGLITYRWRMFRVVDSCGAGIEIRSVPVPRFPPFTPVEGRPGIVPPGDPGTPGWIDPVRLIDGIRRS